MNKEKKLLSIFDLFSLEMVMGYVFINRYTKFVRVIANHSRIKHFALEQFLISILEMIPLNFGFFNNF